MQKINKEIEDLNNTINQLDLIGIYRTLYQAIADIHSSQVFVEHSHG